MKKLLLLMLPALLACSPVAAQELPDEIIPGTYYPDTELDKYTGTWKWTNGKL